MFETKALLTACVALAPGYYQMDLLAPDIAAAAQPGQFLQVRAAAPGSDDPILARPISIYRIRPAAGLVSFIFKAVGRGTRMLAAKRSGELLEVMGPVGKGFAIPRDKPVARVALLAGGIGMPPLYCLAEQWRAAGPLQTPPIDLFYGGRSAVDLLALQSWEKLGCGVYCATDDGSAGFHGLVTEQFAARHLQNRYDYLCACGPTPMLRAVQSLAQREGIPGQLSLEAFMACGVGACLGCACKTEHGYQRVCVDGPVFPLGEVDLS